MSNDYIEAIRAIPEAPRSGAPPNRGWDESVEVAAAIYALSAKLRSLQETPGPSYSFREVSLDVEPYSLTTLGVETVLEDFRKMRYDVSFGGTCSPLATGVIRVSWQY